MKRGMKKIGSGGGFYGAISDRALTCDRVVGDRDAPGKAAGIDFFRDEIRRLPVVRGATGASGVMDDAPFSKEY